VERREELLWLLVQACEPEHGLMCEYLFAQFTLKRSREEGLTDEQLAKVTAWERVLIAVIKQEMLHLALTTNLLTAIGAAPHLHRPNFPMLSRWYPPGVQIALVPFGERALYRGIEQAWSGWSSATARPECSSGRPRPRRPPRCSSGRS
jgi:Ferritin-like